MGGFSFRNPKAKGDEDYEVFYMNLPSRGNWLKVIEDAKLMKALDNASFKCIRDVDGECAQRCCIQNNVVGWCIDAPKLLDVNQHLLVFLDTHPEWKGFDEDWAITDDNFNIVRFASDWEVTHKLVSDFVKVLSEHGDKPLVLLDRCSDDDLYPCPRFLPKWDGEVLEITAELLPYDKAKQMYESGEWEKARKVEYEKAHKAIKEKGYIGFGGVASMPGVTP